MKTATRLLLSALLLMPVTAAAADQATGSYPACARTHWLEAMVEFDATGNDKAYNAWIDRGKCIELRKGLEVEILGYYGDAAHPRVEFTLNGYRFFTVRKAIATEM